MNPANIIDCLFSLVKNNLSLSPTSNVSRKEREVAQHLCETINTFNECKEFECKEVTTLDLGEISDEYESKINNEMTDDNDGSQDDDDWESKENERLSYGLSEYSLEYIKEVVAYADAEDLSGKRRRSWKSIYQAYKRIPPQTYIRCFRNYIEQQGMKRQNGQHIDEMVFKRFTEARQNNLMVHDVDIQRWALKIAKEIKVDELRASDG